MDAQALSQPHNVTLTGERIVLRSITEEDTPLIVKWRNNERVRHNFMFRETFTEEMHNAWYREKVLRGKVIQFIICEKEGMRPVGTVFLQDIDEENKEADYGFLIGEDDAAGKRYGTECIALVKDYCKNTLGLKSLTGKIIEGNQASTKSWTKAGAVIVEAHEDALCSDGTKVNMLFTRMQL